MIEDVTRIDTGASRFEQPSPPAAIGDLLVESGHITPDQLERVLHEQKRRRRRFGELTVKLGFAPQGAVDGALARQFGYPTARSSSGSRLPDGLVTAQSPNLPFAESMRAMRGQLLQRWFTGAPGQSAMAVASVDQGDGKSFICANLAVVFAQLGESTLVIDADLRRPTQQTIFGLRNRMGLSGVLSGRAGLSEVRRMRSLPNLSILPAGAMPPNPQELLSRGTFRRVLKEMSAHFDVILIDTPAAQIASDVHVVSQRAGAALLVARKDHTRAPELNRLASSLSGTGAQVLGSTLNDH
ncbi:MAG: polysaccharide biosynthesis tyrosine autokinase [Burkholderiaceae bacterium]|nr:polysaccharide biosynthesis tyrosine autokinase [Burkholderiaceae bacterium]